MTTEQLHQGQPKNVDILLGFHDKPNPQPFRDVLRHQLEQTEGIVVVVVESILFAEKYTRQLQRSRRNPGTFAEHYYDMFATFEEENPDMAQNVSKKGGGWKFRASQLAVLDELAAEFPDRLHLVVETVPDENVLFEQSMLASRYEHAAAQLIRQEQVTMQDFIRAGRYVQEAVALETMISGEREKRIRRTIEGYVKAPSVSGVVAVFGAGHGDIANITPLPGVTVNVHEETSQTHDGHLYLGVRAELMRQILRNPGQQLDMITTFQAVIAEGLQNALLSYCPNSHVSTKFDSIELIQRILPTGREVSQFLAAVQQEGFDAVAGRTFAIAIQEELGTNPLATEHVLTDNE